MVTDSRKEIIPPIHEETQPNKGALKQFRGVYCSSKQKKSTDACAHVIDLCLDAQVYALLQKRALKDGISVDAALLNMLKRGMVNCPQYSMWERKEDFELIKGLFAQYKHDHELLEALVKQNDLYTEIIKNNIKN